MEIKEYKPLALVFYIDGNGNRSALPLDDSRIEEFKRIIENQKMVQLEGITINTYDIKEIRPACKTSDIEKFYYSRSYQERAMIAQRIRNRVNNQKANVIEALSEYGTGNAINLMSRWLEGEQESKPTTQKTTTTQITDEQKEELKKKFKDILYRYELKKGQN